MANQLTSGRTITDLAKRIFLGVLRGLSGAHLELVCAGETYRFGDADASLHATILIHDDQFFRRAVFGGDIGVGESFMEGEWTTPDLTSLIRIGVRNLQHLESNNFILSALSRLTGFLAHKRNRNTEKGSLRNIAYHYDLGNEFYQLFLDTNLAYSCAFYESTEDSLEKAQIQKFDRICRKLQLEPQDHLLEIGTGWGGFAVYAASAYGCRVTTTTISRQQHDYAQRLFTRSGQAGKRIELLFQDYRNLRGSFDKIVSIEMFEAVGHKHYDDFFGACDRLLKPNGAMLLQTITLLEQRFKSYLKQTDWIKKHIFPGAELASIAGIVLSLSRSTQMQLFQLEDIGQHYSETLKEWRRRFTRQKSEISNLGFGDRFLRMWDYYLAYCEGAFRERYISDVQMLLTKVGSQRRFINEPVSESHLERGLEFAGA